ncbi:trk system potassium uptake protein TrkH [Escherichia coli]|uniref:Trk system potassium uptake protein TrkH n=1 Tax=Escherichia coli TaxID=562 RepID=A0A2X3JU68_ECOLX|nr:trk system potassium uptake protein TrkH [Escherichia coli]
MFSFYRRLRRVNGRWPESDPPSCCLFKQGNRELKRLVHPNAVYSIKLGNRALPERILEAVWGFFSAYALVFIVSMLAIIATGVDDFSAFASVVATLE